MSDYKFKKIEMDDLNPSVAQPPPCGQRHDAADFYGGACSLWFVYFLGGLAGTLSGCGSRGKDFILEVSSAGGSDIRMQLLELLRQQLVADGLGAEGLPDLTRGIALHCLQSGF